MHLKVAQDTLINPVKRFAYERFGPDMLNWQQCSSPRDYLMVGMQRVLPVYAGSILFLVILGVSGYLQWGRFVSSLLILLCQSLTSDDIVALVNILLALHTRISNSNPPILPPHSLQNPQSHPHPNPSPASPPLPTSNTRSQSDFYPLHCCLPAWPRFSTSTDPSVLHNPIH